MVDRDRVSKPLEAPRQILLQNESKLAVSSGYSQQPVAAPRTARPNPRSCTIVKPDQEGDAYANRMASVPEIAVANGRDYSNGLDLVRDFAGVPQGDVPMERWTPGARYYNGVTDRTAKGRVEEKLGEKIGELTSNGMVISGSFTQRGSR